MPPRTPWMLIDNVMDRIRLYAGAILTTSGERVGGEARRVADYRRDRSFWLPPDPGVDPTGHWVQTDLGAGNARNVDALFLDREHVGLWGRSVVVEGSDDALTWAVSVTRTVPAFGVVGGDPSGSRFAVTEEGALYCMLGALSPRRYWRVRLPYAAGVTPALSGIILGRAIQLAGYATQMDEDAGERTAPNESSRAGYRGADVSYSWRRLSLPLATIGAREYDRTIREIRRLLFELDQPCVVAPDWGTAPERAWMYKLESNAWSAPKSRTYRTANVMLREHMHRVSPSTPPKPPAELFSFAPGGASLLGATYTRASVATYMAGPA